MSVLLLQTLYLIIIVCKVTKKLFLYKYDMQFLWIVAERICQDFLLIFFHRSHFRDE